MAKHKSKSIKEIQAALLSNTKILSKEQVVEKTDNGSEIIDADVMRKIHILAEFENVPVEELLNKALSHYLKLKGLQLEQAIKEKGIK